jgi:DNA-directed RNA polymerase beta subunit
MERDSLLAHGAAYLLHDRLHTCSDYHVMDVCTSCGSILAPLSKAQAIRGLSTGIMSGVQVRLLKWCRLRHLRFRAEGQCLAVR